MTDIMIEEDEESARRLLLQFHGGASGQAGTLNPTATALNVDGDTGDTKIVGALYLDPSAVAGSEEFIVQWLREITNDLAFQFGLDIDD